MRVVVTRDVGEFAERARGFVRARIERNILATVLDDAVKEHFTEQAPLFAYATDSRDRVLAAAIRTPPRFMLAGGFDRRSAKPLVDRWIEEDPGLPGVAGMPDATRAIAEAWGGLRRVTTKPSMRMALHELDEVQDPPKPAFGRLREPSDSERALVIQWVGDFHREARDGGPGRSLESIVDGRLADGRLLVWDDGGPVSLVGLNHPVAGAVRIGPVFTPRGQRRRGYAGTAVAEASRRALAKGARKCILYTDLLNPTTNKIYAEVGYRRVADWEELAFEPADAPVRDNPVLNGTADGS